MNARELEAIYEKLAQQLDAVEEEKRALFLAKLVLLLSNELSDRASVEAHIEDAARNLDLA